MSADYSTHTEADAAISAGFDAYPDERMSRADIAEEADFWHWWWNEGRYAEVDPHEWPREAEGPLLEALHRAVDETRGKR
jgi:hypothetical protein